MSAITTARPARPVSNPLIELCNERLAKMSRDEIRAELARLEEMDRRDAEQRARFAQLSPAELNRTIADLEGVLWNAKGVRMNRIKAEIAAERAVPPVEPLDTTAAGPDECYLGEINGAPVLLHFGFDVTADEPWQPYAVACEWGGFRLSVGRDGIALNPADGDVNDMRLDTWGQLRELASAGVVEQLVVLARRILPA